jgi:hypothetical protein
MPLLQRVFAAAVSCLLASCVVPLPVESYSAANGSSESRHGVRCLYPAALNSTELLRRDDLTVSLEVFGADRGRTQFSAALVLESKPGAASLVGNHVRLDSTEFQSSLIGELKQVWAPPDSPRVAYAFSIDMPVMAKEVALTFPNAMVGQESVPIPSLVLKHEQQLQFTGLCE